jgi:uncharacterized protein YndB with AHSA1/START domain
MLDRHAVLLERDGRSVLRFQRALDHPRERVWRALTEHDELAAWHPTPFDFEPRAGAAIDFDPPEDVPAWPRGQVLACEEPSLLVYTWGPPPEDELRWTLEELDGGCLLTLEHHFDDRFKAARDGAGWHLCLQALDALLEGGQAPERGSPDRLPGGWNELNEDYQRRFGIAAGEATPIPGTG